MVLIKSIKQQTALRDLKTCMSLVTAGAPFPGSRNDFDSDDSYINWRKAELDQLQASILRVVTVDKQSLKDTSVDRPQPSARPSSMMFSPLPPGSNGAISNSPMSNNSNGRQSPALHGRSPSIGSSPASRALEYFSSSGGANSGRDSLDNSSIISGSTDFEKIGPADLDTPTPSVPDQQQPEFTYIPTEPRQVYQHLLALCLDTDLDRLRHLDPNEPVSLGILSQTHLDLLSECATWWRLTHRIATVCFLQEVGSRFAADEIPLVQCVTEALKDVDEMGSSDRDTTNPLGWDGWSMGERITLTDSLSELFDTFLRRMYDCIQAAKSSSVEHVALLRESLDLVYGNPVFREAAAHDLPERFKELGEAVRIVAAHQYEKQRTALELNVLLTDIDSADGVDLVFRLQGLLGWIKQAVRAVDKLFSQPILGYALPS